jgi:hypothetical protein
VDPCAMAWFIMKFEIAWLRGTGEAFQDLFSTLMEKRHPADFQRTRPWGSAGDRKNDGYLKSARTLFQVYAPNELKSTHAVAKINEDFQGALDHWHDHFGRWVFVHNSREGLGPQVLRALLDLQTANPSITIEHWGFEELLRIVLDLSEDELTSLFGAPVTRRALMDTGMPDLIPVLDHISRLEPTPEADLRPVPGDKLTQNMLSDHVKVLLKAGMSREALVRQYLRRHADPRQGDKIAAAFTAKYQSLRATPSSPDEVFADLQRWAGGAGIEAPHKQAAILAVLAYMFQECHIFDRPGDPT